MWLVYTERERSVVTLRRVVDFETERYMICSVWECWAFGSHCFHRTRTRVPINQVGREREEVYERLFFFQLEWCYCLWSKTEGI